MQVGTLSAEDLTRWRMSCAEKELVDTGFNGMSVDEGRRAILQYYKILGDILAEYELDDTETIYVSPINGHIYSLVEINGKF